MIACGVLDGRILGGGSGPGLSPDPGYGEILAYAFGTTSAIATGRMKLNPDGTWLARGTGYVDESGNYYAPTTTDIGADYEAKITLTLLAGAGGIVTNPCSSFVSLSVERELIIQVSRYTVSASRGEYSVLIEIRPTGGAVESSFSFDMSVEAEVGGTGGGGGCPSIEMWAGQARQIAELGEGAKLDCVTADEPELVQKLRILGIEVAIQPRYRIVTTNGSAYTGSETTPFTLQDGTSRLIPDMMGQLVKRDNGDGPLVWDEVVECYPVGPGPCARAYVGGHSLLCGEHPQMRILSHNPSKT